MPGITLKNVTKRWGAVTAVDNVSLDVEDGEFVAFLGPSGCGKTTTMRLVAGLEEITEGEIYIGDRLVNEVDPRKRDVSMVFQNYSLFPHMTVRNNLAYPLKVSKVPRADHERMISDTSKMVELSELLDRKPAELSGGQRQRVALGRAIIRRPKVFLMDEPLSNMDAILRQSMRAELKNLHHRLKVTTIYVTHDQVEAMTLATRVAVMKNGVLQQFDKPSAIFENPATSFVAGFVGAPAMNLIEGEIHNRRFVSTLINCPMDADFEGTVTLGVRPLDIHVCGPEDAYGVGRIYSSEMTGEQTIVTVANGKQQIALKEGKDFGRSIDDELHFRFERDRCFFFDVDDGRRLAI
jgi:multiple sugar transport system ATP-binding protein